MYIHPTSIVKTDKIGEGTYIGPFCNISERVVIGKNCKLVGWSSIGNPGEFKVPPIDHGLPIIIEDGVEIREFVTINTPMNTITRVGQSCFLMTKSHVGHDCVLEDNVVLSCGSIAAGYAHIGRYCYLGLNATTHQYAKLGAYCIVGASSFFKGTSPEGIVWAGVPAKPIKVNLHNIKENVELCEQMRIIEAASKFVGGIK